MAEARGGAGALGPRLLGRLTAELIHRSPQYMSCIGYYEIDLRGNKIGAIENLGATENQFDAIDLSDNAIVRLEGFPRLPRLKVLYLNNNRVSKVARNLQESVGSLETLVLTNNRIAELKDIDPLATLPGLTHLSLVGNPVALRPQYRLYTIARLPKLKVLDFKKVKQKERDAAARLAADGGLAAAAAASKTFEPGEGLDANGGGGEGEAEGAGGAAEAPRAAAAPTAEQLTAIKAAIANAQTLEEAERLEAALREGKLPSELAGGGGGGGAGEQQQQQQQNGEAMEEG